MIRKILRTILQRDVAALIISVVFFVEAPFFYLHPLRDILSFDPFLISAILTAIFVCAIRKFVKKWGAAKFAARVILVFWIILQISAITLIEIDYNNLKASLNPPVHDEINSSWTIVTQYRELFEGTYGKNVSLPNRCLKSNPLIGSTPIFWAYLSCGGYEKLVAIQRKGCCGEFATAINTLLHDIIGVRTRVVHMEGIDHAFPEIYLNGSWWVLDAIYTTPNFLVKAESYARYLEENKRDVYENISNIIDAKGKSLLVEHGFEAINITIVAIIDPTSSKTDDRPAKDAEIKIFALKNQFDPLVDKGRTDENGRYETTIRRHGIYIIIAEFDGKFVGILEIDCEKLKDKTKTEIFVRLHKYA